MSNILIHMLVNPHSEYDVFTPTDYPHMAETFRRKNGSCPNLGNRLWFQGLISEITCEENTLTYFREDMTKDYINETFDMIIAPMANVFHTAFGDLLLRLAERFRGIRIPMYVIACGVQADSFDALDELCASIDVPARAFMESVYNTGGEFALRGYFSKEFFDRMGFSSAVVTGCPSLYQLGRNLRIPTEKVPQENFRPLINGELNDYRHLIGQYPNAEFFDQERFFHVLHDPEWDFNLRTLVHSFGFENTKWLLEGKIKMIPNMNDWRNYLREEGFRFSVGSRIHGSIMPLLAGIPALMMPKDSRTREMAEFFEIPTLTQESMNKAESLYSLYLDTDYSRFNRNFGDKFDAYENFLVQCGIVKKANSENVFFRDTTAVTTAGNHSILEQMHEEFCELKWFWKAYSVAHLWKRRLSRGLK